MACWKEDEFDEFGKVFVVLDGGVDCRSFCRER